MWSIKGALDEITYALDVLEFDGVSLFASYGENFLGDARFDPVLARLNEHGAVVFVHPGLHPSSRGLALPWPAFMMEYLFDTTRAVVNLIFSGAIERFPRVRFILPHAGGLVPYFAWRLSVSPMIDPRLPQLSREQVYAGLKHFWYDNALSAGEQTFGTLDHPDSAQPIATPSTTTTYTLTVTDANGCISNKQVTVTVNALPQVSADGRFVRRVARIAPKNAPTASDVDSKP